MLLVKTERPRPGGHRLSNQGPSIGGDSLQDRRSDGFFVRRSGLLGSTVESLIQNKEDGFEVAIRTYFCKR